MIAEEWFVVIEAVIISDAEAVGIESGSKDDAAEAERSPDPTVVDERCSIGDAVSCCSFSGLEDPQ